MFYCLELCDYPVVKKIYTVTRNTVWQISENEHLVIIIRHGECNISCGGEEFRLCAGDIFYIPPGISYLRTPIDERMCTMVYIHFTTNSPIYQESISSLSEKLSGIKKSLDSQMLFGEDNDENFCTIFLESKTTTKDIEQYLKFLPDISPFSSGKSIMSRFRSSVGLCEILVRLSDETVSGVLTDKRLRTGKTVPAKLKKAVEYIALHYSEKISLGELAAHCAVSKQQLIRYFKDSFGSTPNNYITEYKLSRAKELLFNNPQLTIKEISNELGFDNQHYFARVFAKINGETPSQFRYRTVNYGKISKNSFKIQ